MGSRTPLVLRQPHATLTRRNPEQGRGEFDVLALLGFVVRPLLVDLPGRFAIGVQAGDAKDQLSCHKHAFQFCGPRPLRVLTPPFHR